MTTANYLKALKTDILINKMRGLSFHTWHKFRFHDFLINPIVNCDESGEWKIYWIQKEKEE